MNRTTKQTLTTEHAGITATRTSTRSYSHVVWARYTTAAAEADMARAKKNPDHRHSQDVWDAMLQRYSNELAERVARGWQAYNWCGNHRLATQAAAQLAKYGYDVAISEVQL